MGVCFSSAATVSIFAAVPLDRIRARAERARLRARELVRVSRSTRERLGATAGREVKACGCGRAFTRLTWKRLPFVGLWSFDGQRMEARACACRSSLLVPWPLP